MFEEIRTNLMGHERPLVLAHRGGKDEAPENAAESFADALAHSICGAETDVHMTADGELVIMHDASVARTTGSEGVVEEMRLADITALEIGGSGWHVPSLDRFLEVYAGLPDVYVELEMKTGSAFYDDARLERYCRMLHDRATAALVPGTYVFTSFQNRTLATMRRLFPDAPTALIMCGAMTEEKLAEAISLGCAGISPQIPTDPALVVKAHEAGLIVNLWCSDTPELYGEAQAKDADLSTSNRPREILRLCRDA